MCKQKLNINPRMFNIKGNVPGQSLPFDSLSSCHKNGNIVSLYSLASPPEFIGHLMNIGNTRIVDRAAEIFLQM